MKKTSFALTLLSLCATASLSQAAIVSYTVQAFDNTLATSNGTPLAEGSAWRLGTFATLSDSAIAAAASSGNYAVLNADWTSFVTGTIGGVDAAGPGTLFKTGTADNTGFTGKNAFVWVVNQPAFGPITGGTELGIFKSLNSSGNPSLKFPAADDIFDPFAFSFYLPSIPSNHIVFGGQGVGTNPLDPSVSAAPYNLAAPVPEPATTGMLFFIGAACLIRRRRA